MSTYLVKYGPKADDCALVEAVGPEQAARAYMRKHDACERVEVCSVTSHGEFEWRRVVGPVGDLLASIEWRVVTHETLPPADEMVLVAGMGGEGSITIGWRDKASDPPYWRYAEDDFTATSRAPTHWAPMPAAPKSKS